LADERNAISGCAVTAGAPNPLTGELAPEVAHSKWDNRGSSHRCNDGAIVGILLPRREDKGRKAQWLFDAWLLAMILRYVIEAKHLVSDPYNLHLFNPLIAAFAGHALVAIADGAIPYAGDCLPRF
jgi:hypothetical protein